MPLLETTARGLYCAAGDFYIDPWRGVERALITHAHSDHARPGSKYYLTSVPGGPLVRERTGADGKIETLPYGQSLGINGVNVSFHPAGHVLGSSQIRVEHKGEVWVVSGDYKTAPDSTCAPIEVVKCNTFISESTFGLPIFRWDPQEKILSEINQWWSDCQQRGLTAVVFAYALGKAQRVISGLDATIGPILLHGAIDRFMTLYREAGVRLPPTVKADDENAKQYQGRAIVVAPPSAADSPWLRKFKPVSQASASGWMRIRGNRRWRSYDRGFVLSDHADWPGLIDTIRATGAERIGVTHGYAQQFAKYLAEELKLDTFALSTQYVGETGEVGPDAEEATGTVGEIKSTSEDL